MDRKYRCLVVQLGTGAQVVQSLMALKAVQQLYPQVEYHFLVDDSHADAPLAISWLSQVHLFPKKDFLAEKDRRVAQIARWLSPFADQGWDFVFNWSTTETSSYLTTIIPSLIKYGLMRNKDLTSFMPDGWTQYRVGVVNENASQNIHLTDLLTTQMLTAFQIHLGDPENAGNQVVTSKNFFDSIANLSRVESQITVQIDGYEKELAKFSRYVLQKDPALTIRILSRNDSIEVEEQFFEDLLSSSFDGTLLERVQFKRKTSDFDRLSQELSSAEWLISGDPEGVQIASVLGTRCLFIAGSLPGLYRNGPYGNGHWIIQSNEPITGADIYSAFSYILEPSAEAKSQFENINLMSSSVRSPDMGGGATYQSVNRGALTTQAWFSKTCGQIARQWYCGWTPPMDQEFNREQLSPELVKELRESADSLKVLSQIYDEAYRTAGRLQQKSQRLKSEKLMSLEERDQIQKLGAKLKELDMLSDRMGRVKPMLTIFPNMLKVMMHNVQGTTISQMAIEAQENYKMLQDGAKTMSDMVAHALSLSKPVAVKTRPLTLVK
ncbi:MAG: hypothetical protein KA715_03135 [Xanthomonadaceae bacterium]|nr:hypothetical protein [Xanthomonadaceae bacterium]